MLPCFLQVTTERVAFFKSMADLSDYMTVTVEDDALVIGLGGDWTINNAYDLEKVLAELCPSCEGVDTIIFRCDGLRRIDTSGAWLLYKQYKLYADKGVQTRFEHFSKNQFKFFQNLLDILEENPKPPRRRVPGLGDAMHMLGRMVIAALHHMGEVLFFLGRLFMIFLGALAAPRRFRPKSIIRHIYEAGIQAVPIIILLVFLIAIVLTYQGANQLSKFGAEYYTIGLTVRSILREMGVLMVAILIAGRSGSAFATEIGIMRINEEVSALKTISLDPYEVLVLPRVMALVFIMPFVTFVANMAGLLGGAVANNILLDLSYSTYWDYMHTPVVQREFWIGLFKAPFLGFLIATTACFRGLQAESSAESVGRLTTISVVQSIFLVMAANAVFAIIFGELGY